VLLKITLDNGLKVDIQNLIINVTALLVARIACVMVRPIATEKGKKDAELRVFLVKLSGRQVRQKIEFTTRL